MSERDRKGTNPGDIRPSGGWDGRSDYFRAGEGGGAACGYEGPHGEGQGFRDEDGRDDEDPPCRRPLERSRNEEAHYRRGRQGDGDGYGSGRGGRDVAFHGEGRTFRGRRQPAQARDGE